MAGATVASAAPPPVDINGDGVPDQYQLDTDGDGYVDSWFTDVDNDGTIDEGAVDLDRNLTVDLWVVDGDHDGLTDAAYVDSNGDGYPDNLVMGIAYDGVRGPNPPLSGPGVIGGGGSSGTGYPEIDAINAAANQRMIDNWLAPACNASYNGCA